MARSARVRAPVRVLDAGGWTDTWFAASGLVCNVAMDEGADVTVRWERRGDRHTPTSVNLRVAAFGDQYRFPLDDPPGRHPLLESALRRWAPRAGRIDVTVASAVPPGSSLGSSASVVVALIAALNVVCERTIDRASLARAAHEVEVRDLDLQSGVQDQVAAVHGGANLIAIEPYPATEVRAVDLGPTLWTALTERLVTVHLGTAHVSSAVHEAVITRLTGTDSERLLEPLRAAARTAAEALVAGDIDAYGDAMVANTEAQAALHPALVTDRARQVIELAEHFGSAGWKVNGAGGPGGTVTIVGPEDPNGLLAALTTAPGLTVLPLRPAREGVRVVDLA